ncbi:unnamed protein product [Mytilus coruscus]|uniref:Reverse transcriptase domain-containing protein n=1 Tax=Mytilus coruscus TaxID=42192 RepID=A0A6J8E9B3_MYTCO|nr:unnamed protein product [Mytilus coruscus]
MLTVNFQSIKSKQGLIKNLVESTKPDIVLGTETWIDSYVKDNQIFPPNYNIYRNDRNMKGGGVLIAINNDQLSTPVPELQTNFEIVWAKISLAAGNSRFEVDFIIEALGIVLEENTFYFDWEMYMQIKGSAMGNKVASSYANLVKGFLEKQMYEKVAEIFDPDFQNYEENNWKRYLDDCIIFWTRSKEDLIKFRDLLNTLYKIHNGDKRN